MVSEKPPRRSKSNKEPVTIDLTAEETVAVAEPVRANDTDDIPPAPEPSATETPLATDTVETPAAAEATPEPDVTPAPADTASEPEKAETQPAAPRFDEPDAAPTTSEDTPEPDEPKPYSQYRQTSASTEPKPAEKKPAAPATSTLVASGIFGGIVALLLAGSMQYAGFLPGGPSGSDDEVTAELAALRQEITALSSRPADASGDLANRIAALENATAAAPAPDEALATRLAALESELSGLRSATESNTGRLQQAEAEIKDRGPEQMAARAVAAAALKSAIDRGGSFEAELETYKTLAADDPAIVQLQPLAAKGVLSRVELQRQASNVASDMIDAVSQPDPNLGLGERLLASAMSVVKVRKVGDVEGTTPDAIIARFEDRLRAGDLPGAAREWAALPQEAKAASQSYKQELDARIEVENLIGGALTRAITGTQG